MSVHIFYLFGVVTFAKRRQAFRPQSVVGYLDVVDGIPVPLVEEAGEVVRGLHAYQKYKCMCVNVLRKSVIFK